MSDSLNANVVDLGTSTIEALMRQVTNLKSNLCEKEETIRQLQINSPQQSPVSVNLDQPTVAPSLPKSRNLPQTQGPEPQISRRHPPCGQGGHRKTCPPDPVSPNVHLFKQQNIKRSKSLSCPEGGHKVLKSLRRNSLTINRFMVLADVKEDSEHLMPEK